MKQIEVGKLPQAYLFIYREQTNYLFLHFKLIFDRKARRKF